MGDAVACRGGVMAEPEIFEYVINKEDKMIVIASDGVWEFLENIDVRSTLPTRLQVLFILSLRNEMLKARPKLLFVNHLSDGDR
jgi:serine/threonine protein phosphatase PrpC